jgi:hypothetical protein
MFHPQNLFSLPMSHLIVSHIFSARVPGASALEHSPIRATI